MRFNETGAAENPEPNGSFTPTRSYVWGNKYYRAGRRLTNVPILRLGDMYTLRASTRIKTGDLAGARADLDAVRIRAGLDPFTGSDAELENAIMNERFKEMAFEGDRFYYLQGMQVEIPAGDRGGSGVAFDSPFYSEIPDYETQLNQGFSN